MVLAPFTADGTTLEDERASAFVAGEADPSEVFGPSEGQTLLGLAGLAVLTSFVLLMIGAKTHRRCNAKLDALEAKLSAKDGPHV
jgi:hypothetical protein